MSWFSCLAVPASFPCCANVNRTSRWAPKNTTSRQPHSWQLLFMALPKWMGISVQTFHHAPAATHKSHWFPANLHLFYSGWLKLGTGRETDRQKERERENIYNDLKDLKRRMGLAFERDLRDRNRKGKTVPLFQCIFVRVENGNYLYPQSDSILSAYIHKNQTSSSITQFSVAMFFLVLYFLGPHEEWKKVILSLLKLSI